jgi:hypothetical protein
VNLLSVGASRRYQAVQRDTCIDPGTKYNGEYLGLSSHLKYPGYVSIHAKQLEVVLV